MRNLIVGILIGLVLGGTLAWAALEINITDGRGNILGIQSNPLKVIGV